MFFVLLIMKIYGGALQDVVGWDATCSHSEGTPHLWNVFQTSKIHLLLTSSAQAGQPLQSGFKKLLF